MFFIYILLLVLLLLLLYYYCYYYYYYYYYILLLLLLLLYDMYVSFGSREKVCRFSYADVQIFTPTLHMPLLHDLLRPGLKSNISEQVLSK